MRKSLAVLQFALVVTFAAAASRGGALSTFDPQPDPPATRWMSRGLIAVNPGGTVSLNPQPLPPRYFWSANG